MIWAGAIRALQRCGNWDNGSRARSGLIVNTNNLPTNTNTNISFRADSNYSQEAGAQVQLSRAGFKGAHSPCLLMLTGKILKTATAWLVGYLRRSGGPHSSGSHMKRHADLFDSVCDIENLFNAYRVCLRGKRLRRGVLPFTYNLSREIYQIQEELKTGKYQTGRYHSFYVHEPKKRLVQSLPFRDRVVQQALCQVINPIFEQTFIKDTYACIKGRGTHAGSDQLVNYMRKAQARFGKAYCLQCDIASYFPSIDHAILVDMFDKKIKCRKTMDLIRLITDSNGQSVGIPIGNLLSQLSANIYLNVLDHHAKEHWRLPYYIRYMDDFCILHGSKKYLWWLKGEIQTFLHNRLALILNRKSSMFPISQGVDFLGYRTWTTHKLIRKRSINKARRKLKAMVRLYHAGKIGMNKISESARSWSAHCEHANTYRLRQTLFKNLDSYINTNGAN